VIVAPNFNNTAITLLVQNLIKGNQVYAMMPAGFASDDKVIHLDDMACATGGTVFGPGAQPLPAKAEEVNLGYLGQADKATITKDTTTILGGKGNAEEIQQRLESLQSTIARTASDFDKEKLQERAGRLGGGIAVIRVGGNSEVEIKEIKDRVEDALHATRAAAADGIVPGGGVTLLRAKATVSGMDWGCENSDQVLGGNILLQALEAPIRCIVDNAGGKSDVVVDKIVRGEAPGYNAYTEVYEDLMEAGVVDPARVTTAALTNAVSIAGMLLTTSCAITIDRSMVTSDPNQGF
jgi:chaperonin GroEL